MPFTTESIVQLVGAVALLEPSSVCFMYIYDLVFACQIAGTMNKYMCTLTSIHICIRCVRRRTCARIRIYHDDIHCTCECVYVCVCLRALVCVFQLCRSCKQSILVLTLACLLSLPIFVSSFSSLPFVLTQLSSFPTLLYLCNRCESSVSRIVISSS